MARPRYSDEWWSEVREYLANHPEEGFDEDEVKQFMKYVTNQYMANEGMKFSKDQLKDLIQEIRSE